MNASLKNKNLWAAALLGMLLFLSACSVFEETRAQADAPETIPVVIPGVPQEAVPLFAENCAACHGPTGGGSEIAPALDSEELRTRLTDDELQQTITRGRPGTAMPAWGDRLTEEEIEALVALIRNWDKMDDKQIAALAEQAADCSPGMGMHPGMGMRGPMMGGGCGGSQSRGPWWFPFRP